MQRKLFNRFKLSKPLAISLTAAFSIICLFGSYHKILKQIWCTINGVIFHGNLDQRRFVNEDRTPMSRLYSFIAPGLEPSIEHSFPTVNVGVCLIRLPTMISVSHHPNTSLRVYLVWFI